MPIRQPEMPPDLIKEVKITWGGASPQTSILDGPLMWSQIPTLSPAKFLATPLMYNDALDTLSRGTSCIQHLKELEYKKMNQGVCEVDYLDHFIDGFINSYVYVAS